MLYAHPVEERKLQAVEVLAFSGQINYKVNEI